MELTVTQFAKKHGVTRQAVLKRIWKRTLKAKKLGNYWIINV